MRCKLIRAQDKEFTNDKQELIRGLSLTFYDEKTGTTQTYFVGLDDLRGYDPKQLATIKGMDLEVSTNVKTYQGKSRVVLDRIFPAS